MDPYREGLFTSLIYCRKCGIVMHHENLKYPDGTLKLEGSQYACRGRSQIKSRKGCGLMVKDGYLQAIVAGQIQMLMPRLKNKNWGKADSSWEIEDPDVSHISEEGAKKVRIKVRRAKESSRGSK